MFSTISTFTLDKQLAAQITGENEPADSFCRRKIVVVEKRTLELRPYYLCQRLFCCCYYHCCSRSANAAWAFNTYLSETHQQLGILAQELTQVDLTALSVLFAQDAWKIMKKIECLSNRYDDLNKLVKWIHWHKIYQEALPKQTQDEKANDEQLTDPPTPHRRSIHGTIKKLNITDLYRLLEDIPIENMTPGDLLILKEDLKNHAVLFTLDYDACKPAIVRELINRNWKISPPPETLVSKTLRKKIENYDSAEILPARYWEILLERPESYMAGLSTPMTSSLGDNSLKIIEAVRSDSARKTLLQAASPTSSIQ